MPKIIYIIGTARSGTTLVDILLGNQPGIHSLGELNRYPRNLGSLSPQELKSKTISFWADFKNQFLDEYPEYKNFKMLENLTHSFEYHGSFIKRLLGFSGSKWQKEYFVYLKSFFSTLTKLTDNQVIIDSSKYPGRAYYLSKIFSKEEIIFLRVKRSPAAVVKSFEKKGTEQPSKGWFGANLYYFGVSFIIWFVSTKIKSTHRYSSIKYEDLIEFPKKTLEKVENELHIDLDTVKQKVENNEQLIVGNLFDGNRLRFNEEILLKVKDNPEPKNFKYKIAAILNFIWY